LTQEFKPDETKKLAETHEIVDTYRGYMFVKCPNTGLRYKVIGVVSILGLFCPGCGFKILI